MTDSTSESGTSGLLFKFLSAELKTMKLKEFTATQRRNGESIDQK